MIPPVTTETKNETKNSYDITILQTPELGQTKGYRQVFRYDVVASCHEEAIYKVFRTFNVKDLMPKQSIARFMRTWDILLFDEGLNGKTYYQLQPDGWKKIRRIHVR